MTHAHGEGPAASGTINTSPAMSATVTRHRVTPQWAGPLRGSATYAAIVSCEYRPHWQRSMTRRPNWSGTRWFYGQTEACNVILTARTTMREQEAPQPTWFYLTPGDR